MVVVPWLEPPPNHQGVARGAVARERRVMRGVSRVRLDLCSENKTKKTKTTEKDPCGVGASFSSFFRPDGQTDGWET